MNGYIFGIAISLGMIAVGISGFFIEGGVTNGPAFIVVGTIFLIINIVIFIRARKRGDL